MAIVVKGGVLGIAQHLSPARSKTLSHAKVSQSALAPLCAYTHYRRGIGAGIIYCQPPLCLDPKTQLAPAFRADGIALHRAGGWLYYHALAGVILYKIKTADLLDESRTPAQVSARVMNLGPPQKPDGMLKGRDGTVYLTSIEQNAIVRYAITGHYEIVAQDPRLQWPDTMAWGPDGKLYVTCPQIHRMPKYHQGKSLQQGPYMLYRLKVP